MSADGPNPDLDSWLSQARRPSSPSNIPTATNGDTDGNHSNGTDSVRSISLSSNTGSIHNLDVQTPSRKASSRVSPNFFEVASSSPPHDRATDVAVGNGMDGDGYSEVISVAGRSHVSNMFDNDVVTAINTGYPPSYLHSLESPISAKKARPESLLVTSAEEDIILGVALVDFNHLVGPQIEWSEGSIFDDPEIARILPFLALPDGSHMSSEDYSYFHVVITSNKAKTVFGISCNRQIDASTLLFRLPDVTRSIVQKAIVVVAGKPIFGPIRDKLGVVTQAFFEQKNFSETKILSDFHSSLESTVRFQLTESTLYIGTNLRALVHAFRHRTLLLLKALMIQKKILFYGHPVERLCTFQYSLVSLIPGLLHTLEDCGSPPLASRASTLSRPNSLKTSDRASLLAYMGLPLDLFGKDAFFQPYIPLQQLDMLNDSRSWLCGTTNSMVCQQGEVDLLVNIEDMTFDFHNQHLEKLIGITSADRIWIDEIVRDVSDSWNPNDPTKPTHMQFKGSEDYIRTKFEEYISSCLSSIRYHQFLTKGESSGVSIADGSASDVNAWQHYHPAWIEAFKRTRAYEVWDRVADPMVFDIIEPRHPGGHKVTAISDIGLRLQEGLHELKLEQQLAPTREALTTAFANGSTSFMKAMDGVKGRWNAGRRESNSSIQSGSTGTGTSIGSPPVEIHGREIEEEAKVKRVSSISDGAREAVPITESLKTMAAPLGVVAGQAGTRVSAWGVGIGSFISSRASRLGGRGSTVENSRKTSEGNGTTTTTTSATESVGKGVEGEETVTIVL